MLIHPRSRQGSAAAILILLLQLLSSGLLPVADARVSAADESANVVRVEKPGTAHHAHNPHTCVFCITMQLGAVPAPTSQAPDPGVVRRFVARPDFASLNPTAVPTPQVARGPPAV